MFSSNSNNNKTDSHSISIEVGCTGATSGPCDLSIERQSPNSPSKVKCVNDANCTNTMATYYYCYVHDSAICCNCAYREQQKEKQEKQKANKYDDNDVYIPDKRDIIKGDNEYKYDGPNSPSTKKKNKENKKRKLAPSESADKFEPQHKKRKFDLEDLANLTGNDVIKKVNEKQNEINRLKKSSQQAIEKLNEKIRKLNGYIAKKDNDIANLQKCNRKTVAEKDEKIRGLQKYSNELNMDKKVQQTKSINAMAKKDEEIRRLQENINELNMDKTVQDQRIVQLEETNIKCKRIMKDKLTEINAITVKYNRMKADYDVLKQSNMKLKDNINHYDNDIAEKDQRISQLEKTHKNNETVRKQLMEENNTLKRDNEIKDKDLNRCENKNKEFETQRKILKHARDNCTYQQFNNALNIFLDGSN